MPLPSLRADRGQIKRYRYRYRININEADRYFNREKATFFAPPDPKPRLYGIRERRSLTVRAAVLGSVSGRMRKIRGSAENRRIRSFPKNHTEAYTS